jgi:hypothetical protein
MIPNPTPKIITLPINRFFLPQIIKYFNYKNYTEVGTDKGVFTDFILQTTNVTGVGVDPYELNHLSEYKCFGDGGDDCVVPSDELKANRESLQALLSKYGDRFTLFHEHSKIYGRLLKSKSLDVVFLDGDHSPEGVLNDLNIFYDKVKDGGLLCGHDYGGFFGSERSVVGVKPAVDQFVEKNNLTCYITEPDFFYTSSLSKNPYIEGLQSFFIFKNINVDIEDLVQYCYTNLVGDQTMSGSRFKKEANIQLQKQLKKQSIVGIGNNTSSKTDITIKHEDIYTKQSPQIA